MTKVDPLTLAVIQAALQQVCNEMDIAFSRSAFSPVIAEADDRSSGIYDRVTGALISQGELGLPVFVGTMQHSTAELIRLIGEGKAGAPEPGDIYIINDPYLGGTHLMDVRFAMPFYYQGRLFCWLQNTGHWPDVGGMVPGGFSAHATEVEQEGLRLPPVKLFKRGEMDQEIYAILCSNMRVADQRIGDIKAQAAALYVGERRLGDLIDRYGLGTITAAIAEMRERAALLMRSYIAEIPDGTYKSQAFVDSDGVVDAPLKIALTVIKADGVLYFDFSESSPPCRGPMNSVIATTCSSVYLAMRHIFPDTPLNSGAFEPLRIARPEGTFLDARYPRPVAGCAAEVSQRIAEAVFLALVQAIPHKVTAAPAGTSGNFALGGSDPARGIGYVMYQMSGGGYGGNSDHDGLTNGCSTIGISKTPPVEVMEQVFPVLYHRFALREGSGGAGARRGGFGVHYEVELLRGDARASFVMDHGRFGPPGVLGGADGAPNVVRIHRNGTTTIPEHLSKDQGIPMRAGDRVEVMTPGGGGYGDPLARDPAAVARDVRLGYYDREEVRALFGVALSAEGEVDAVATEHLRAPPAIANGATRAEGGHSPDAGPRAADRGSGTQSTDSLAPDQARGSASRMTGASR
jgi:N-methylhydantoinase B